MARKFIAPGGGMRPAWVLLIVSVFVVIAFLGFIVWSGCCMA